MTTAQELPNGSCPSPSLKSEIDHPTRSSGESHQQEELSPVDRVIPNEHRERGISPPPDDSSYRCQFTFSDGRQCRNPAKVYPPDDPSQVKGQKVAGQRARFCPHHSSTKERKDRRDGFPDEDLAGLGAEGAPVAALVGCSDLTSATSINRALTQVFLLMAQGRISQKQAVAFGYISQLLLQTLPGVRAEFVSVYDPNRWRQKLQASLEQIEENDADESDDDGDDTDPDDRGEYRATSDPTAHLNAQIVERQKGVLSRESHGDQELSRVKRSTPFLAQKESILSEPAKHDERRIPHKLVSNEKEPTSAPVNRPGVPERESDDFSPQNARVAGVITLVPRTADHPTRPSGESHQQDELLPAKRVIPSEQRARGILPNSPPPPPPVSPAARKRLARDFYGNPIPRADWWCSFPGAARHVTKMAIPGEKFERETSQGQPASPPAVIPSESAKPDERGIPPKSHAANSMPPWSDLSSAPASSPPPFADGQRRNRHTTTWFAPASWSGRQKPDPYPGGAGKLRHKFTSLANSAFRRLQHQNSRGFWSPGAKHLAT